MTFIDARMEGSESLLYAYCRFVAGRFLAAENEQFKGGYLPKFGHNACNPLEARLHLDAA